MSDVHFKVWFFLKSLGLGVCVPAKCGGTAFYRWAFAVPDDVPDRDARSFAVAVALATGQGPFSPEEVSRYFHDAPKLLAVRDPGSRFASLWRDKCRLPAGASATPNPRLPLRGATPRDLAERVLAHPLGDPHWAPQYLQHVPGCEVVDYRALGPRLGYDRRANATERRDDDPPMPTEVLLAHYALDYALWWRTTR